MRKYRHHHNGKNGMISDQKHGFNDKVAITGLSGRLPESNNIEEFKDQLFAGVDLITDDERRWPTGTYGLPVRNGKLKDLKYFDASFFCVHAKQAHVMDPQLRILLELTYEAIVDAGINPQEIRGSKTGVFIGVSSTETDEFWTGDTEKISGYGLTGCCRAMFPNRISYTYDFVGPSYAIDTACSSSMFAFQQAVTAMRSGECDAAIVGGVNLLLKPSYSLQFHRLGMLNPEGMCKSFDASGNGYVRSEAAVVVFLQKASEAKRIYATVVGAKTNTDGYKSQGITYPSVTMQTRLMRELYEECGINPHEVSYVEAHGTGTKVGDPEEGNAIAEVFCKNRSTTLLVGSVKSNMGHSEPASGLCSLAKVIIAMERGMIPGNLHFDIPNPDIPALNDGRIQVVYKNWLWDGGLVAINSFGFGGANAHILLRSHNKPATRSPKETTPRVVAVSGRTEQAVNNWLQKIENIPFDNELFALLHNIHGMNTPGHHYRGYTILGIPESIREVSKVKAEKRPIWFVFSGMGCQWTGMAKDLMRLETFANAMKECAKVLRPKGIDLLSIVLSTDSNIFDNVLNSFVCITSFQVSLLHVLKAVGISPDGMVGHSLGELACAYADGTLTIKQTVLAAYSRGRAIIDSHLPPGSMAVIGLSWKEAEARKPSAIQVACHNDEDVVTISGPSESLRSFVKDLQKENIFAKEIKSSGVAFHSKYIEDAAPRLRAMLQDIIPRPKPRSIRWISSSVSEDAWETPLAKTSSADYHVNNFVSPVLFHEAVKHIPDGVLVIEVAPHCQLLPVLKSSLRPNCTSVGLVKRLEPDNLVFFLSSLGKAFISGALVKFQNLIHRVNFPVGCKTPMIASMIEWDHSVEWDVAEFSRTGYGSYSGTVVEIDLTGESDAYISGHVIDGRVLYPATGYLCLIWKMFGRFHGKDIEEMPIILENVQFLRATVIPKAGAIKFYINLLGNTGDFEIVEGDTVVVTGRVRLPEDTEKEQFALPLPSIPEGNFHDLEMADIYKELRFRGYEYSGAFRGVRTADNFGVSGKLEWNGNWITYIDTMLQFSCLSLSTRDLYLATRIQRICIDPHKQKQMCAQMGPENTLPVHMYRDVETVQSGGVEIRGIRASRASRRLQPPPILEEYAFVPLMADEPMLFHHALTALLQLALENSEGALKIKVMELASEAVTDDVLAPTIINILESQPLFSVDYMIATGDTEINDASSSSFGARVVTMEDIKGTLQSTCHLAVGRNLSKSSVQTSLLSASLRPGGFLLLQENLEVAESAIPDIGLELISMVKNNHQVYVLLRKTINQQTPTVINITDQQYIWVDTLKEAMKQSDIEGKHFLLVSQGDNCMGILGLMNCIKQESSSDNFRVVFVEDIKAPPFCLSLPMYKNQLKKGLVFNVLRNGLWGTMRHLKLNAEIEQQNVEHAYINTVTREELSSLKWTMSPLKFYSHEDYESDELCTVYFAPLNFRDIMVATGTLSIDALPEDVTNKDFVLGLEFSGRDATGCRVIGMVAGRGLATTVLADPAFLWKVPETWTLEEASTIPIAYATSYYALVVRGRMKTGEKVLIHAGAGGVGLAAITIALHMGCQVYTTVGSEEKRRFLKELFPQLTDNNIAYSRDSSFEQQVLQNTNGRGVDLILNSLAHEMFQTSMRCMAKNGRFLEIGKMDLYENSAIGSSVFLKNTTFHGIQLDALFHKDSNTEEKKAVSSFLTEGIYNGSIKPLPATVFSKNQVEQCFRLMASGKHIGKLLLKIREEEPTLKLIPEMKFVSAVPRIYMNPRKSYILAGGLGSFGVELVNWMIDRGAKNIVLSSRRGVRTGYQYLCIRRWKNSKANVTVSNADITLAAGAEQLISEAAEMGPVGGIFNLAAVLRIGLIENQTIEDFAAVCNPKVEGTKNLDSVSRKLCPELDYFVAFSSFACGRGITGQTNYGLANSAMERICERRHADGLPALAIQWGAIGDTGLILDTIGENSSVLAGILPQKISSCLESMETMLLQPHAVVACMVLADKNNAGSSDSSACLVQRVGNILGIRDVKTVDMSNTLVELGMDSIMGAEIKQLLEKHYDKVQTLKDIRGLTFQKLNELSTGIF